MSDASSSHLGEAMSVLGISAVELSSEVGISNSLISRWQKGTRPIPLRGDTLEKLAETLVRLDTGRELDELVALYGVENSKKKALIRYLTESNIPGVPVSSEPLSIPQSGEYVVEQRVLLGEKGFRKATLLMLDYMTMLPHGQELTICAHSGLELWHSNLPFALQVLQKLAGVLKKDARVTLVTRNAEGFDGSHYFSVFWLAAQLKGIIRTRYYDGEAPDEYFVASIKGFWSARVERDSTAEDNMISTLFTDPRSIHKDEDYVQAFIERSTPAGQFGFLLHPEEGAQSNKALECKSLPRQSFPKAPCPDGSFSAICRLPLFGIMTPQEWAESCEEGTHLKLPEYLFSKEAQFAAAPHRIILCEEDVKEGLSGKGQHNSALSKALGYEVYTSRDVLASQLHRLLDAMCTNPDFEVALMPRSAFQKLEIELVYWKDSVSLGWLQNGGESLFTVDPLTCTGFKNAVDHVWGRLHKGWKRKKNVKATFRKWLVGEGLNESEPDSPNVRNWQVRPGD